MAAGGLSKVNAGAPTREKNIYAFCVNIRQFTGNSPLQSAFSPRHAVADSSKAIAKQPWSGQLTSFFLCTHKGKAKKKTEKEREGKEKKRKG